LASQVFQVVFTPEARSRENEISRLASQVFQVVFTPEASSRENVKNRLLSGFCA